MEYFISNFKAQTYKSVGVTILISFVATYLFWNSESILGLFTGSGQVFLAPFSFFIPFIVNIIICVIGLTFLISRKNLAHGLLVGTILVAITLLPDFISSGLNNETNVTPLVYLMVTIAAAIKYILPAGLLAHLRKH